eukprot:gb/GECH01011013.1/.p1 GENE.gb/GECH01011013.1/~~gb/GECH01011013.1/.p1  ORF type:complete len:248 (+),score=9.60 gb/GECH01011013.1/:1-744(+)
MPEDFRPKIMIDNCNAYIQAIKENDLTPILCKFHLLKAWTAFLKTHVEENLQKPLAEILLKIFLARDYENYKNLLIKLSKTHNKFYQHFCDQYDSKWKMVTSLERPSHYALYNTNIHLEGYIKSLQHFLKKNNKMINTLKGIQRRMDFDAINLDRETKKRENPSRRESEQKLEEAKECQIECPKMDGCHSATIPSFTKTDKYYDVYLYPFMCCSCIYHMRNGKACKHIFFPVKNILSFKLFSIHTKF